MTTDAGERTETLPDGTEIPAPVEEQSQIPASDAGQDSIADAGSDAPQGAALSDTDLEGAADAAFEEYQKSKEGKEPAPEARPKRPQVDQREVEEALQSYETNYRNRQKWAEDLDIDQFNLETDAGRKALKSALKDRINEQYADGRSYAGYQADQLARQEVIGMVEQGIFDALPESSHESYNAFVQSKVDAKETVNWSDVFDHVREDGRKQGQNEGEKSGFKEGYRKARSELDPSRNNGRSGATPQGRGTGGRSEAEILMDPDTPINTIKEIRSRQKAEGR